ncbi:protein TIC 62, chloroplastic isoform X4 [Impatiens glandulifera]|uniref:protein TIC 62, chloroplastic isoform X4 n=1 Tax=Impatiens glandulifera TaxID=253017 RepID=UPI001FB17442|nr:protein TIC 62, chloroplastic isoform X4 [Impatiens glandulifera]
MELRALQSPSIRGTQPFIHTGLRERPFFTANPIQILRPKNNPNARKLHLLNTTTVWASPSSGAKVVVKAILKDGDAKDEGLVFVAGSTGKVGSRTVRELLKLGFRVKAGVRSVQRAESLVQSVRQLKLDDGTQSIEKLELVECDLEKRDEIKPALGKASVVICCIGASEKEVFDITGPYRIDYQATKNLIDAAKSAKVNHFILVTSLGTNKVGFPAAILNLFWGVLIWKRQAEEALLASGLPYTIVRPGGMERPTDAYKKTHNLTLSEQDTLFGGQVSNLQVAELLAFLAKNRSLSYCKVLEVIAETTAPLTPINKLLEKISSDRVEVKSVKEAETDNPPQPTIVSKVVTSEPLSIPTKKEESKEEPKIVRPLSPYYSYEDLTPPTSPTPTPPSSSSGTAIEAEPKVVKAYPLSPYAMYDDLKPPSSPSPSPPILSPHDTNIEEIVSSSPTIDDAKAETTILEEETSETINSNTVVLEVQTPSWPLSPYTAYEDLKPPSSPSPIPSGPKQTPSNVSATNEAGSDLLGGNNSSKDSNSDESPTTILFTFETLSNVSAMPEVESNLLGGNDSSQDSPTTVYDDLKPPSSPSPSPPILSPSDTKIEEIVSSSPTIDDAKAETTILEEEISETINSNTVVLEVQTPSWPLSPYTAYEDLKPPSSPSPLPSGPKQTPSNVSATNEAESGLLGGNNSSKDSDSDESPTTILFSFETPSNVFATPEIEPNLLGSNDSSQDSPTTVYDDLKPPSSPSPTPSILSPSDTNIEEIVSSSPTIDDAKAETTILEEETFETINSNTVVLEVQTPSWPLSPYTAYEDLKPPSSPSPLPSGPKQTPLNVSAMNEAESDLLGGINSSNDSNSDESPTTIFDYNAVTTSGNSMPQPSGESDLLGNNKHEELKPRPLSPYAMYEDLKPPSSPSSIQS